MQIVTVDEIATHRASMDLLMFKERFNIIYKLLFFMEIPFHLELATADCQSTNEWIGSQNQFSDVIDWMITNTRHDLILWPTFICWVQVMFRLL